MRSKIKCGDNFLAFVLRIFCLSQRKLIKIFSFFCVLWTCVGIGVCRLCRNSICIGFPFKAPRFQSAPYFPFSITTFSFYTNDIFFLFIIICFWSISKALSSDFMNIFFLFLSRLPCSFIFSPSHVVHLNFVCFIFRFLLELPPLKLFYDQSISYCPSCFFFNFLFFLEPSLSKLFYIQSISCCPSCCHTHCITHCIHVYTLYHTVTRPGHCTL